MRRKKSFEQGARVDRSGTRDHLQQLPEARKQQEREGNGGEQSLEGEGARKKRNVVLVGSL
jgi:hypothetical protein